MSRKRSHKANKRDMVRKRDGDLCFYCARELLFLPRYSARQHEALPNIATIDHIIPRSEGGTAHIDNVVLACAPCNKRRGARPAGQFLAEMMAGSGGTA